MKEQKHIDLAKAHSEFAPAEKYFVTTDDKVFTDAQEAVNNATIISAGNPVVVVVDADELTMIDFSKNELSKAEIIKAAQEKVAAMQVIVDEKTAAKETAEGNKKGAATNALNKAIANLEAAQKELVDAEALTEE